jgi:mannose-6-phosphate isomerase-like protein (cupin superfamily)
MNPIKKKKSVAVVGSIYKYLATGEDTGGAYSLFEALVPPKDPGPPPHLHRNEDEAFYVLQGEFSIYLGGENSARSPVILLPPRHKASFGSNPSKSAGCS